MMTLDTHYYLMWFRQDLRILDNVALSVCCEQAAAKQMGVLAVVYLTPTQWQQHDKSLWQIDLLLRQITDLKSRLAALNIGLIIRTVPDFDRQADDLIALCQQCAVSHIFVNHEYLVNEIDRDHKVKQSARQLGVDTTWCDDHYIVAPNRIVTGKGQFYKVFTPFYKQWLALLETTPLSLQPVPNLNPISTIKLAELLTHVPQDLTIETFYQTHYVATPDFDKQLQNINTQATTQYPAGESAALDRLESFLADDIEDYNTARDKPALYNYLGATSRISRYLALGIISPRLCYIKAREKLAQDSGHEKDILRWISELAWRDFYGNVIVNRPDMVKGHAFLDTLDKQVSWRYDDADFAAWCQGKTGVPLVDAAMRCLNDTGFMHNRLRMVVAMYLTKNLLIDWRLGERYFMQHLVDGDFASNNGGWQWSASIGTDAQPYFRVMSPFSQAASHDADGAFIKHWLPELTHIPVATLQDESKLQAYLQKNPQIDYPLLAMPTKVSRQLAIEAFKTARAANTVSQSS